MPVISVESGQPNEPAQEIRSAAIQIVNGAVMVRVPAGAEAVRRSQLMSGGILIPPGPVRVSVATQPMNFRKGVNGLAALVQEQLQADPFSDMIAVSARNEPTG